MTERVGNLDESEELFDPLSAYPSCRYFGIIENETGCE